MESFLETQESVMAAFLQQMGSPGAVVPEVSEMEPVAGETITAVAAVAPLPARATIADALLQIVSDRTGYPLEMLGLDLDLEADLGIDSIKRVEILSALQQLAGNEQVIAETAMEEIARLKTLRQVLDFLASTASHTDPLPPAAGVPLRKGDTKTAEPASGREAAGGRSQRHVSAGPAPRALTATGTITAHEPEST